MGTGFPQTLPGELALNGYHTQGVGKMHFFPQRALNGFHNTVLDESGRRHDPWFVSDYQKWLRRQLPSLPEDFPGHGLSWNSWISRPWPLPEQYHQTNWTVDQSLEFLREKDPFAPFFMLTSFSKPHSPYDAPSHYYEKYMKRDLPAPFEGDWSRIHDNLADGMDPDAWHGRVDPSHIKEARSGYYASIEHIDHQLGRIVNYLKRTKQFDDTLIIFTSDHGDMLGDHFMWRKTYAYEGSSHIPLIMKLPRDMAKDVVPHADIPAIIYDIMPTILDVLGVETPTAVDGKSLKPALFGNPVPGREFIHGEHSRCYSADQECQYVTDGRTKYVYLPGPDIEQLFDLENDPGETMDLSKDENYSDVLDAWRSRLVSILDLRGPGYTDGTRPVSWSGKGPMVSPKYKERMDSAGYDWNRYRAPHPGVAPMD
jgi:arylsulfatase A-like enzyme